MGSHERGPMPPRIYETPGMTPTNTDAAREAAAIEIWEFGVRKEIAREYANAAIDTFLSKSLEGADEKLAEIRERATEDEQRQWLIAEPLMWLVQAARDRAELLTLVTALSAKNAQQDEMIADLELHLSRALGNPEIASFKEENDRLQSQLTAQKAAHAKMLRDMCATFRGDWQAELCRLADKIEGGE